MSAKHNKKTKTIKSVSERYTLQNVFVNYFLVVAFAVFPFFVNLTLNAQFPFLHFDNGYFEIRHQKYYFFLIMAAATVIAEVMLLLTKSSEENKQANPAKKYILNSLSFTDWAVIGFILVCAISTLFSAHIDTALTGEDNGHGRNNGLILYLCYAAIYFVITRLYRYKEYVFTVMAIVNGVIFLIALLNGFHIDPLNMFAPFKDGVDNNVYFNFITTIGNKNMFSSHICVTLPIMMTMFVHSESTRRRIVYLVSTLLGGMAAVVCDSDSVVLGMGIFIAVFLVLYCRQPKRLGRFCVSVFALLCGIKLVNLFAILSNGNYKELGAIPFKLMQSNLTFVLIAFFAVVAAVMLLTAHQLPALRFHAAVQIALGVLFGLAVIAGVGVIIYYSVFNTKQDLGELERTLRFSDSWGTHRGFMWRKSAEAFVNFNVFEKLFGKGPENFYYVFSPYFGELYDRFGDTSTDAAHNEYLNYLINVGILGLASYLAFSFGAMFRGIKAAAKKPVTLVFVSVIVAYLAQAVVNIALPIATPLFILCIALCEAMARQTKKEVLP